jgi:hypothetical protein
MNPEMGKKLYVGNLSYEVTDSALEQMFAAHGTVQSAQVIMDRDTGAFLSSLPLPFLLRRRPVPLAFSCRRQ